MEPLSAEFVRTSRYVSVSTSVASVRNAYHPDGPLLRHEEFHNNTGRSLLKQTARVQEFTEDVAQEVRRKPIVAAGYVRDFATVMSRLPKAFKVLL